MNYKLKIYNNHELFIFQSSQYIEFNEIQELIGMDQNPIKDSIILIKENNNEFIEYINNDDEEENIKMGKRLHVAIKNIEKKYKLKN